jgi:iron complex outermembrane receptor protein/hemoglobin/transferrin/lactoferrin receptor protein
LPTPPTHRLLLSLTVLVAGLAEARAEEDYETVVRAHAGGQEELPVERATSTVGRRDLERRLPRSAPDALRYEPGVFVQQTAHGQGSAYLRGLTGQQTLLLFDGIRLNNSTYRQGPNQYFFTLDSHTIRSIEVERGGGSTRWGSDALGGVIYTHPIEPTITGDPFSVEPRVLARAATADSEAGGRIQLDASGTTKRAGGVGIGFVGGFGGRNVGLLRGPPVLNPASTTDAGPLPWVPRYREYNPLLPFDRQGDLGTQLGTSFQELTGDGRLVLRLPRDQQLTIAAYLYREYNAPRTDQCPPPASPFDQCLTYEQQFRHLAYAAWRGNLGRFAERARVTLSWQEQHEQRRLDLTAANLVGRGVDDVESFGLTLRAQTAPLRAARWLALRVDYGADTYVDWVRSRAEHTYFDTLDTVEESRGQYLDGATHVTGGLYGDLLAELGPRISVNGGVRLSWSAARAAADPQSGSLPVDRAWVPVVGHVGVEARAAGPLRLFLNYDHSFRAPNLDDMTSRQQTGPGFQFENPGLEPERAHTFELGARLRTRWIVADAWLFETLLESGIIKVSKDAADCPTSTPQCAASWSRLQLQNSPSLSELRGAEAAVLLRLPLGLSLRASLTYVWSEGPRLGELDYGGEGVVLGDRVPLSRTPPLNGTAELAWAHPSGLSAGAALQWAAPQGRLAIADYSDGRIPKYGTPGFAVIHLRASYRFARRLLVALVLENLLDSPYRFHGSSVNGAGRGLIMQLEVAHGL